MPHMKQTSTWMDWVGVGTFLVVTVFAFTLYPTSDARRWPVLGLLLLSTVLQLWPPERQPITAWQSQQLEHLRLLVLTLLSLLMVWLGINYTAMIILYFVYSGRALYIFPTRVGYGWVFSLGVVTTVVMLWGLWPEWASALLSGLGATCGYLFVGSAANAQRRAEAMTAALQVAHRQLQEYATSVEALAVAEERNRLAREMHDTLGHRLTVAAVQLEGAQKLIARDPDKAERMIGTVRGQVLEGLTELRRTVAALRAPLAEELPLHMALSRLVATFVDATGLDVKLTLPEQIPLLNAPLRQALYRTAQEALTNIQRHAQATQVTIALVLEPEMTVNMSVTRGTDEGAGAGALMIRLCVEDDGIGMMESGVEQGFGLRGLAERAAALQGEFTVGPGVNGGTALTLSLPLAGVPDHSAQHKCARGGVDG